jgi:RHS repeat-associated protein
MPQGQGHKANDVFAPKGAWQSDVSASEMCLGYDAFGSLLPGRHENSSSSRYLFQGQEHDDELHGSEGTSYAFEYRMHDARVGRFLSIDPLAFIYPWNTPYAFSENRVMDMIELEGLEATPTDDKKQEDNPKNDLPNGGEGWTEEFSDVGPGVSFRAFKGPQPSVNSNSPSNSTTQEVPEQAGNSNSHASTSSASSQQGLTSFKSLKPRNTVAESWGLNYKKLNNSLVNTTIEMYSMNQSGAGFGAGEWTWTNFKESVGMIGVCIDFKEESLEKRIRELTRKATSSKTLLGRGRIKSMVTFAQKELQVIKSVSKKMPFIGGAIGAIDLAYNWNTWDKTQRAKGAADIVLGFAITNPVFGLLYWGGSIGFGALYKSPKE